MFGTQIIIKIIKSLKSTRIFTTFYIACFIIAEDRLVLEQANILESKIINGESVKFIQGDVVFKKGNLILKCQKGEYFERKKQAILYDEVSAFKDELTFVADTLKFYSNSNQLLGIGKSHTWTPSYDLKADTIRIFTELDSGIASKDIELIQDHQKIKSDKIIYKNYPKIKKLSYSAIGNVEIEDSTIFSESEIANYNSINESTVLEGNPKIFDQSRVLSGDQIKLIYNENNLERIYIPSNASSEIIKIGFIKRESDLLERSSFIDKIEGKELYGSFSNDKLDSIKLNGMSKTLYHVFEDSLYKGKNQVSGDSIIISFNENQIKELEVYGGAEGTYNPDSSENNITSPILYEAEKIHYMLKIKETNLFGNSSITHDKTNLKAGHININWNNSILNAYPNSINWSDEYSAPVIKESNKDPMTGEQMTYNLNSKKGRIKKGSTKADDGYYKGNKIQNETSNTIFIENSTYTTCDLDIAHFHFESHNMKIIQDDIVVARPIILHIAQIPVLGIPFGIFPHKGGQRHSGWIMPSYGDNKNRGQYIQGLGYYWAPNDYWDSKMTMGFGDKQGYTFKVNTLYRLRYKFNGSLNFSNRQFLSGTKNIGDIFGDKQVSTAVRWNHKQQMRNDQSLNANITYSSSGEYNKKYGLTESERMDQKAISNISYSKRWPRSKNSMSLSYYSNQDLLIQDKINSNSNYYVNPSRAGTQLNSKNQTFPKFSFRHGQSNFFPTTAIDKKWYNTITWNYGLNYTNIKRVYFESIESDTNQFSWNNNQEDDENNGWVHTSAINAPQKLFKYISINPRINIKSAWVNKTYDGIWDENENKFIKSEKKGFDYRTTGSFSINSSTQVYGLIPIPFGPIRSIRHVVSPNIGYSWTPDFSEEVFGKDFGYVKKKYNDEGFEIGSLDRFSGTIAGGTPKSEQKSMTFGVNNTFQAKLSDNEGESKVDLFNWRINSGYNLAADSLHFANIRSSIRSKILKKLNLDLSMTHDMYSYDNKKNRRTSNFNRNNSGVITPRLVNARLATSIRIKSKRWDQNDDDQMTTMNDTTLITEELMDLEVDKSVKNIKSSINNNQLWSTTINLSYSLNAQNPSNKSKTFWANTNSIINITNKWRISYRARFDLLQKDLVNHSFSVYRDLHCWELSLNWNPSGLGQGINFKINVKSPTLKDLKLEKKGGVYSGAGI